jgi:hypothetical protein
MLGFDVPLPMMATPIAPLMIDAMLVDEEAPRQLLRVCRFSVWFKTSFWLNIVVSRNILWVSFGSSSCSKESGVRPSSSPSHH